MNSTDLDTIIDLWYTYHSSPNGDSGKLYLQWMVYGADGWYSDHGWFTGHLSLYLLCSVDTSRLYCHL